MTEPDHLVPGWVAAGSSFSILNALYAPLVALKPDGTLDYVQAESVSSEDSRVWTIKLREGWTFHDGTPITAQDYANTVNAAAYGPNAWGTNGLTINIEGYDALNPESGEPKTDKLTGVEVVDDLTLRVTLKAPNGGFPLWLLHPGSPFKALPPAAFDDMAAFEESPVGSGPFMMDGKWEHNREIPMKRFDDYQGPKANAEKLVFKIYQDGGAAYTDLEAGNVDILGGFPAVPSGRESQLEDRFGKDHVVVSDAIGATWLGVSKSDERLQDVRIRQALSMAVDREGINEAVFGGYRVPSTGIYPPGWFGGSTEACGPTCDFDPDEAKKVLDSAGGIEGELVLYYTPQGQPKEMVEAIANSFRQNLGIDVGIKAYPTAADYFEDLAKFEARGLVVGGVLSSIPLRDYGLRSFQCTGQYLMTTGGHCDEAIDARIAAATAKPAEEAVSDLQAVEEDLMAKAYVLPLLWNGTIFVGGPRVSEMPTKPGSAYLDYAGVQVSD
ncbi:peptide ABC transporter substrate-binding protein [Phytohabitans kaempferiae]|uniref:ABC transporter substrate-binding protein n=1 Tax=Phytohabitans kaempferiae TaxID=1620943 RepID=A0ABV6MI78_9ACTN